MLGLSTKSSLGLNPWNAPPARSTGVASDLEKFSRDATAVGNSLEIMRGLVGYRIDVGFCKEHEHFDHIIIIIIINAVVKASKRFSVTTRQGVLLLTVFLDNLFYGIFALCIDLRPQLFIRRHVKNGLT